MTEQEALEVIKKASVVIISDDVNGFECAINRAMKALEKQIPKKPEYVDTRFRNHGRHVSDGCSLDKCYKCPNCNSHIFHIFDSQIYCPDCGQALDWSDENETN